MVDWKDYREKCRRDAISCKRLYDDRDYGNSAYLLQQSLEKYVKMVLYHGKVLPIPIMTHNPLEEFVKDIRPAFVKLDEVIEKYDLYGSPPKSVQVQLEYLRQCEKIIPKLGKPSYKVALWKRSLGISLDSNEEALLQGFSYFQEYYRFNMNRFYIEKAGTDRGKEMMDEINKDPDFKNVRYYRSVAEVGRMILATFPHEAFGRYPTDIPLDAGTRTTTELYEQHKKQLWQLIECVTNHILSQI